jgi:RND superfamily putative drug exporter
VPLVAILATVTLQPALLSYVGKDNIHPIAPRVNIFATLTRFIIKRPLKVFLTTLLALAIASLPLLALRVTPSSLSAIPHSLESERALELVTKSAGSGSITPSEVLIDLGSANQAVQQNVARERLVAEISNNPEVFLVATGSKDPYVDPTGRYMRIYIIGKHDLGAPQTQRFIRDLRHQLSHSTIFPPDTKIYLGGAPAQGVDLLKRIAASSIWIIALILLVTYLLLYRVFQSAVLPLKAIALDVISISVAIASIVGLMRFENYHLTSVEAWVLIFLFAMLFGLSMDYEVFIVSRIKEARDSGASDSDAIIDGMSETGGVVTAAASIFIIAVGGLVFGHFAGLQELGIGLVAGVLIDATIIRLFLLPSAMVLLGKWNWWRW